MLPEKGTFDLVLVRDLFAKESYATWKQQLSKGACDKAAQLYKGFSLDAERALGAKLRLARCFYDQEDYTKARTWYEQSLKNAGSLRDHVLFWLADAMDQEKSDKAGDVYAKVSKTSRFYGLARLRSAQAAYKKGAYKQVLALLKGSKRLEEDETAWWLVARALLKMGGPKNRLRARSYMRKVLVKEPMTTEAQEIESRIRNGQLRLKLSLSARVYRANKLNKHYAYRLALRTLAGIRLPKNTPRKIKCLFFYNRGFAHFRRRRYRSAIPQLKRAEGLCDGFDYQMVRTLFRLAQSYRRLGRGSRAIPYYRKVARLFPKHYLADDSMFSVAELIERWGKLKRARRIYASLKQQFPNGDMAKVAQWRIAYQWYRKRDWRKTESHMRSIFKGYPKHRYAAASLYFSARAMEKSGRPRARVLKRYLTLIKHYPLYYYAFLAIQRVKMLHKPGWKICYEPMKTCRAVVQKGKPITLPWGPLPRKSWKHEAQLRHFTGKKRAILSSDTYQLGARLFRFGLREQAAREWMYMTRCSFFKDAKARGRRRCGLRGDQGAELMALHYQLVNKYHFSDRVYRRRGKIAGRVPPKGAALSSWFLAYPRPFWEYVKPASTKDRVIPALAYGLMREESTFNPQIQSYAKAYGLMQMIMSTARATARTRPRPLRGRSSVSVEELLTPAINIRLGIRHLRVLLNQFDDKLPMVIGGYNAGSRWVKRWLRRSPQLPLDEWVEAISIKQTRKYVKRVLQSYSIYHFLYGASGQDVGHFGPIEPAWVPGTLLKK
tara:strand:- start:22930 stop:25257 length:2328 start_codon:yes stop_codon:yes gene_type:complete